MARRRVAGSDAEGGAVRAGEEQRRPGIAGGVARRPASPGGQLLLREDSGVARSAPEDLGADPVELAAAGAAPAAPGCPLVDRTEVPARHIAGRTLPERMDARRDDVAHRNNGNNQNR